jgi:hypothetical protein
VPPRWLLLIHQIPPKPDYFRVKVRRRLQRIGAAPIKNSVYALPDREESYEDFRWLLSEIVADGGDGSICRATFVDGLTTEAIEDLFRAERASDYEALAADARALRRTIPAGHPISIDRLVSIEGEIARLRRRLSEVVALDFFGAREYRVVEELLVGLELRASTARADRSTDVVTAANTRGRTWVTREDIFVDRIASAWLIERVIDPEARFKFVPASGYRPLAEELRFDMFEAEFTHLGDRCTFEVLLDRFALRDDPALVAIAEIVHDIDIKDAKFGRAEASGVERLITGIVRGAGGDDERRQRGGALCAMLYESLQIQPPHESSEGARSASEVMTRSAREERPNERPNERSVAVNARRKK